MNLREISGRARTHASFFGGGVDRNENEVGLINGTINVGAEEEVLIATRNNNVVEPRFINGKDARGPRSDANGVHVDDDDLDIRALVSDDGAGGSTSLFIDEMQESARMEGSRSVTVGIKRGGRGGGIESRKVEIAHTDIASTDTADGFNDGHVEMK